MVVGIQELFSVIVSEAGLCQDHQAATETAQSKQKSNFHLHHLACMKLAANQAYLYILAAGAELLVIILKIIIVCLLVH